MAGKNKPLQPDIFVDNNVAKNFSNPMSDDYKSFIQWLFRKGHLVVSQKLLNEYKRTTKAAFSPTNIGILVERLQRDGRLIKKEKQELDALPFKKHVVKNLRSNKDDHEHIKVVLLSDRKYAISMDNGLRHDLNHFPGHKAKAVANPKDIHYDTN